MQPLKETTKSTNAQKVWPWKHTSIICDLHQIRKNSTQIKELYLDDDKFCQDPCESWSR